MTERLVRIIEPDNTETGLLDTLPEEPTYFQIAPFVAPYLNGARLEHVRVWYRDCYCSMFVDERGHEKGLERNETATEIYRANVLVHVPGTDPEDLPWIAGTAVLFDRNVWF